MITNRFHLLPTSIYHLHRVLQYLIGSVLIASTWYYHSTELPVLTMFIIMNIHQTLVLLLNLKYSIASSVKLTHIIVFMDGIVSGLLIQFLGLSHTLSLGMGGLFYWFILKPFRELLTWQYLA